MFCVKQGLPNFEMEKLQFDIVVMKVSLIICGFVNARANWRTKIMNKFGLLINFIFKYDARNWIEILNHIYQWVFVTQLVPFYGLAFNTTILNYVW